MSAVFNPELCSTLRRVVPPGTLVPGYLRAPQAGGVHPPVLLGMQDIISAGLVGAGGGAGVVVGGG